MTEDQKEKYNKLRVNKLFLTVPSEQLSILVEYFQLVSFEKGKYIYRKNSRDNMCYLISNGAVELTIPRGKNQAQLFLTIEAGDYFGEIELLAKSARVTQAKALTDVELFTINYDTFFIVLQECHIASLNLLKDLSKKTIQMIHTI